MRTLTVASSLVCMTAITGCGLSKQSQLEAVARDWCMTIRASQVIPVYPLTEDIQPGDVFLVQTPVDRQQAIYKQKGFLPLDNHLCRLNPTGYGEFYGHSFLVGDGAASTLLPARWIRVPNQSASWSPAPNAAFPTYSFATSASAGLNLAVPISGVPVGLSLMGTESARGTVTIDDARTMGVDTVSLFEDLQAWALLHQDFLEPFAPPDGKPVRNYLRVITRVYATGRLDVTLADASSFAGGADVGVPRPVDLISARAPEGHVDTEAATLENYRRSIDSLNATLAASQPPPSDSAATPSEGAADAKTQAMRAAAAAERKRREDDLKAAEDALAKAKNAAKPAHEEVAKAAADVRAKQAALEAAADEASRTQARKDRDAAEAKLETARANSLLKAEDTAQVTNDFARRNLAQLLQMAPGGSTRITAAASRFISMQERFDPPLIIGYLGFDVPILADGRLGPPIPTHAHIDPESQGGALSSQAVVEALFAKGVDNLVYDKLKEATDPASRKAIASLDALGTRVPDSFELYQEADAGLRVIRQPYANHDYLDFKAHRGHLKSTIGVLGRKLATGESFQVKELDGQDRQVAPGTPEWQKLVARRHELQQVWEDPETEQAHRRASVAAGTAYVRLLAGLGPRR